MATLLSMEGPLCAWHPSSVWKMPARHSSGGSNRQAAYVPTCLVFGAAAACVVPAPATVLVVYWEVVVSHGSGRKLWGVSCGLQSVPLGLEDAWQWICVCTRDGVAVGARVQDMGER